MVVSNNTGLVKAIPLNGRGSGLEKSQIRVRGVFCMTMTGEYFPVVQVDGGQTISNVG